MTRTMPAIGWAGLALVIGSAMAAPDDHRVFFVSAAALVYLAAVALVSFHARRLPPRPFGLANVVTLARLAIACVFAAHAVTLMIGVMRSHAFAHGAVSLGLAALLLDGVDGWLARRLATANAFGARFDMEVDAFFILVLSVVGWASGKAGAWVLMIGAARYVYVAAGFLWPALTRPLFPSQRRKAVAALQVAVLIVLIAPEVTPPLSTTFAAGALAFLLYSFAVDIRWQIGGTLAPALSAAAPE